MKISIKSDSIPVDKDDVPHNLAILTDRPIKYQPDKLDGHHLTYEIIGGQANDLIVIQAFGFIAVEL